MASRGGAWTEAFEEAAGEVREFLGDDSEFSEAQVRKAVQKARGDVDEAVELLLDEDEEVMAATCGGAGSEAGTAAKPVGGTVTETAERTEEKGVSAAQRDENASTRPSQRAEKEAAGRAEEPSGSAGRAKEPSGSAGPDKPAVGLLGLLGAAPSRSAAPAPAAAGRGPPDAPSLSRLGRHLHGEGLTVAVEEGGHGAAEDGALEAARRSVRLVTGSLARLFVGTGVDVFSFAEPSPDDVERAKRDRDRVSGGGKSRRAVRRMASRGRSDKPVRQLDPDALEIGGSDGDDDPDRSWRRREADDAEGDEEGDDEEGAADWDEVRERRLGLLKPLAAAARAAAVGRGLAAAPAEACRSRRVCFAGPLQSGKSSLVGRLLADLGRVSAAEVYSLQQKSRLAKVPGSALAWAVDSGEASRRAGQSFAATPVPFPELGAVLVDTPGLRRFAGAAYAAASTCASCVLVVSALPGEFERHFRDGGQGREAVAAAVAAGCSRFVVAVNKLNKAGWAESRFRAVAARALDALAAAGVPLASATAVPVSGTAGENVGAAPKDSRLRGWWADAPTLADEVRRVASEAAAEGALDRSAAAEGPARLRFLAPGLAHVESGAVARGDRLTSYPDGRRVVVTALPGRPADAAAVAGEDARVELADPAHMYDEERARRKAKRARERRGTPGPAAAAASSSGPPPAVAAAFGAPPPRDVGGGEALHARVDTLHALRKPLARGDELVLRTLAHDARGTRDVPCSVARVAAVLDRATGERRPPPKRGQAPCVENDASAVVVLELGAGQRLLADGGAGSLARFLLCDPGTGNHVAAAWTAPDEYGAL